MIRRLFLGAVIALALPIVAPPLADASARHLAPPAVAVEDFSPRQLCAALSASQDLVGYGARFTARALAAAGGYVAATFVDAASPRSSALVVLKRGPRGCTGVMLATLPTAPPSASELVRFGVTPMAAASLATQLEAGGHTGRRDAAR